MNWCRPPVILVLILVEKLWLSIEQGHCAGIEYLPMTYLAHDIKTMTLWVTSQVIMPKTGYHGNQNIYFAGASIASTFNGNAFAAALLISMAIVLPTALAASNPVKEREVCAFFFLVAPGKGEFWACMSIKSQFLLTIQCCDCYFSCHTYTIPNRVQGVSLSIVPLLKTHWPIWVSVNI